VSYTQGHLAEVASRLRQMQPETRPKSTMRQAVEQLLPELLAMKDRGFQVDQIAQLLATNGIAIAASTLKAYMRRAQMTKTATKERKRNHARPVKANGTETARLELVETRAAHQGTFTARADSDEI